jgi:hypothetical protein
MSATELELDEVLAGDEPDFDAEPIPPAGTEHANRMLRRLARLQREQQAAEDLANAERERINNWLAGEQLRIVKQQVWLEQSLAQFHRAVLALDPKAIKISLPNGELQSRKQQPVWDFDDETFLEWAEQHAPDLIRHPDPPPTPPPAIDKAAAKKALTPVDVDDTVERWVVAEGGEVVPGVTVTVRDRKYTIEVTP